MYLEEKWTFSYLDKLVDFMKIINSHVNRVTKLALNKVTKKDVPRLASLSAEQVVSQKPSFFVEDFVRIVKKQSIQKGLRTIVY